MVHGWTTKSRDIGPVSRAIEGALCSKTPRDHYLVGGLGSILAFIDEYAVNVTINKYSYWFNNDRDMNYESNEVINTTIRDDFV